MSKATTMTLVQRYMADDLLPYIRQHTLFGSEPIRLFEIAQPPGDSSDPPLSDLLIAVALTRHKSCGSTDYVRFAHRQAIREVCITPPNTAVSLVIDDPNKFQVVAIPDAQVRNVLAEILPTDNIADVKPFRPGFRDNGLISLLVERLWQNAHQLAVAGKMLSDAIAITLISEVARVVAKQNAPARGGLAPGQLGRVREYLAASLDQAIGLAELATLAGLSPAHFSRAFKQSVGHSPIQELITLRMEHARSLLTNSHLPVIEVAALCGYHSPSAFAQVFRKYTGLGPNERRRRF